MTRSRSALVIGAGIAGPATAIALHKAGIEARLYEAHAEEADGVGAFLTLASNGIHALRVLDADGAALAAGFPTPAITLRSSTGKRLGQALTGGILADGTPSQTMRRTDLYRALRDEAAGRGVPIEHGKRVAAIDDSGDGVRVQFADGSHAAGDILIGCDGVHSTVRRLIDPAAPRPTYAGLLNTGGYVRGVDVGEPDPNYEMIFGRRAFFGYAVAPGGEVWWFANVPSRDEPAGGRSDQPAGDELRRRLLDLFADDNGPAVALIEATDELMPLSPIHSIPRLPVWHKGRVVVAGDAAHAPTPSSGQGASLSIEDAVVLARCLRDSPDPSAAFAAFEAARRRRVERIIKWAARVNSSKAAGPVGRRLRDVMMPPILRLTANSKTQREIYDHQVTWDGSAPARTFAVH